MHSYGSWPDENFNKIDEISKYIGSNLIKWCRMSIFTYKEKFGTVRVYCRLGWRSIHSIFYPEYTWIFNWWPYSLDCKIFNYLLFWINYIVIPIQKSGYRYFYKKAIKKYPFLKQEILCCADYPELLEEL